MVKPPVRNRSKGRAFDKLYSSFSDEFKKHFEALPRHEQTPIINNGFEKVGGRLMSRVMDNFTMSETVQHNRERKNVVLGKALIKEKAEVKLGGASKFQGTQNPQGAGKVPLCDIMNN